MTPTRSSHLPGNALAASTLDKIMLREARNATHDSRLHTGGVVCIPGPAPALEAAWPIVAKVVEQAIAHVPVLRHRLVGSGRHARWEPDPHFDAARHITEYRVVAQRSIGAALLEAWEHIPLPRDRPLWSVVLLTGYSPSEFALCYRAHHAFQDGLAALRTCEALLGSAALPHPGPPPRCKLPSMRVLWHGLRDLAPLALRPAAWLPPVRHPSHGRVLHTLVLDPDAVDEISRRTNSTPTQVGLTVLAGALRNWQPQHWEESASRRQRRGLPVAMSMSVRSAADQAALGNQLGLLPLALPCPEPSPARRLQRIRQQTGVGRVLLHRKLQSFAWRLPYLLAQMLWLVFVRRSVPDHLLVTSFSLPDHHTGTAATARKSFAIPPLVLKGPGMIGFLIQGKTVTASCVFDASIPGTDRLPSLIARALAELRAAVSDVEHTPGYKSAAEEITEAQLD